MVRTGLACEAGSLAGGNISGIRHEKEDVSGMLLERVFVRDKQASIVLGKPRGRYISLTAGENWHRDEDAFSAAASALSGELSALLPGEGTVLVVGLGNRDITFDAVGPLMAERTVVTAHVAKEHGLRPVCAMAPGVMGTTGMDTSELISAVCARLRPAAVIAVDALSCADENRLCRTFQLSDAGIVPGDGAGTGRRPLNKELLGVPVIAFGIPTVMWGEGGLLRTPPDIDMRVRRCCGLMAWAVNMALLGEMSRQEMDALLGL